MVTNCLRVATTSNAGLLMKLECSSKTKMKVYHYTSIENLALILSSQKIRFTRLDLLDDIREINGLPQELLANLFVSCWTEEGFENLSLWSLYTNMKGVRIELDQKFYDEHLIKKGDYGYWGYAEDTYTPLALNEIRTDDYIIGNPFWLEDGFYVKVQYDHASPEKKREYISEESDSIEVKHPVNLVRFKDSIWAFQNESRFFLLAQPLPPLSLFNDDRHEQMKNLGNYEVVNKIRNIDVGIRKDELDRVVVRLHPNCNEADKVIVNSLLRHHTAYGEIEDSKLNGIYRSR